MNKKGVNKMKLFLLLLPMMLMIDILPNCGIDQCSIIDKQKECVSNIDFVRLNKIKERFVESKHSCLLVDDETPHQDNFDHIFSQSVPFYQDTTFDMKSYFRYLYENSPENSQGSCGNVSLIQLLAYYDTFYNDCIIPETYDYSGSYSNDAVAKQHSPGVFKYLYDPTQYSSYREYCQQTEEVNIQSKLTMINNRLFNNHSNWQNSNNSEIFENSSGCWQYQEMLDEFYGEEDFADVSFYNSLTQTQYMDFIKNSIDSNNPVVVHIKQIDDDGNMLAYHSVVAYDYDDVNIYANFGYGSYSTHMPLLYGTYGYNLITYVSTVSFPNLSHDHSNNYKIGDRMICGCNLSDEVYFRNDSRWKNVPPTLYWMKNSNDNDEFYSVKFIGLNIIGSPYISREIQITNNQITIPVDIWESIMNSTINNYYFVFARSSYGVVLQPHTYIYSKSGFREMRTQEFNQYLRYLPNAFSDQINNFNTVLNNGNQLTISALGCIVDTNEMVISSRRSNVSYSYFEVTSSLEMYRLDFNASLYSNMEYINEDDTLLNIQYMDEQNHWKVIYNLMLDTVLCNTRNNKDSFSIVFPQGINSFRIYMSTIVGTSNSGGRVAFDNFVIYS